MTALQALAFRNVQDQLSRIAMAASRIADDITPPCSLSGALKESVADVFRQVGEVREAIGIVLEDASE